MVCTDLGQLPGEAENKGWIAGELLHHLTFLKLLQVINLSRIDVTCRATSGVDSSGTVQEEVDTGQLAIVDA